MKILTLNLRKMKILTISSCKDLSYININVYRIRRDFGKLIQTICKTCGGSTIYSFFFNLLKQAVTEAQT